MTPVENDIAHLRKTKQIMKGSEGAWHSTLCVRGHTKKPLGLSARILKDTPRCWHMRAIKENSIT